MLKKFRKRAASPLERLEEQAVRQRLPYALAEVLVGFAEAGRIVTQAELPLMTAVVANILRNEALRARGAEP